MIIQENCSPSLKKFMAILFFVILSMKMTAYFIREWGLK